MSDSETSSQADKTQSKEISQVLPVGSPSLLETPVRPEVSQTIGESTTSRQAVFPESIDNSKPKKQVEIKKADNVDDKSTKIATKATEDASAKRKSDTPIDPDPDSFVNQEITNDSELILTLDWICRDKTIQNLSRYTAILYSQPKIRNVDEKKELIDDNQNLISQLINLRLRPKDGKFGEKIALDDTEEARSNSYLVKLPTFDMRWSLRERLVNNLIKNHQLTLMYGHEIDDLTKRSMINENKSLVQEMLNLQVRTVKTSVWDFRSLSDKVSDEKEEADKKLCNFKNELKVEINEELYKIVNRTLNNRSEVIFTYKVTSLKEFFSEYQNRVSELVYCRGIPFFVRVEFTKKDNVDTLSVYLHCDYEPISSEWMCKTIYRLTLLNHSAHTNSRDLTRKCEFVFRGRDGFGYADFISHHDLTSLKHSYIKDDAFYIRLDLIADKPNGI